MYLTWPYTLGLEFKFRVWISEVLVLGTNFKRAFLPVGRCALSQGSWVSAPSHPSARCPVPAQPAQWLRGPVSSPSSPHLPQHTLSKFIIYVARSWMLCLRESQLHSWAVTWADVTCNTWGCCLISSHVNPSGFARPLPWSWHLGARVGMEAGLESSCSLWFPVTRAVKLNIYRALSVYTVLYWGFQVSGFQTLGPIGLWEFSPGTAKCGNEGSVVSFS